MKVEAEELDFFIFAIPDPDEPEKGRAKQDDVRVNSDYSNVIPIDKEKE